MPEKATTPAAPAAPTSPTPAAPAAPAAATPASKAPLTAPRVEKPKLSAKKALGLEASPRKMVEQETQKARDRVRRDTPVTADLEPVSVTPATPAAPATTAAPVPDPVAPAVADPVAAAPVVPTKVEELEAKIAELESKLKGQPSAPAPAAPQAPAATAPAAPEAKPEPQLTAEQVSKMEADFVKTTAESLDVPLTEQQMDAILGGGPEAVATLISIRKNDMARTILEARKGVAAGLNPVMEQIFSALRPLVENHEQLQRYTVEQQFLSKHKDFVPHLPTARAIAEELLKRFPQQVAKMTQDQFIDEVARQTDVVLTNEHRRWFPTGDGNWRTQAAPAPAAAPAAPAAPAPAPTPVPPAAPAAPAVAAPAAARPARAPAATVPIGTPAGASADWKASVARSLRA